MTALRVTEVFRGQFQKSRTGKGWRNVRYLQILIILIALGLGVLNYHFGISTKNFGDLLTATSIITGLTFAMAMTFWERRVALGREPQTTGYEERSKIIVSVSIHLIWTVMVGVVCTACLGYAALVSDTELGVPLTSISASLLSYQLMLVAEALVKLYNSSIELST